jgi:hypothetical protein
VYSELWSPGLRQGDIVGPLALPLLGKRFEVVGRGSSLTTTAQLEPVGKVIIEGVEAFTAVVSHDCEFNEGKRNKLLVARLQRVQGNLTEEELDAVWASNDVEARVEADQPIAAVDSFIVAPLNGLFPEPQVINFATTTPLPMAMKDDLLAAKKAEMDHDFRVLFRKKLAWFFGRDAEDIPDADKRPPPEPEAGHTEDSHEDGERD